MSGLKLSRNRGHQNALVAGLMTARELCDITISLDADLQDDIEVLDQFVEEYHKGAQIVYGVRSAREMVMSHSSRAVKSPATSAF